jgi:hypothetical protein
VGAVFRWIQDNTHQDRPLTSANVPEEKHLSQQLFCASCGIDAAFHRKTQPSELTANGMVCGNAIARLPLVDVNWWIKRHRQFGYWGYRVMVPGPPQDLIRVCEPSLLAMAAFVMRRVRRNPFTISSFQEAPEQLERLNTLAACGLLGLLVEIYVRKVTQMSIAVLQELTRLAGLSAEGVQCLTRSHVHRALLQGAFKGGLPEAIFTGCAEIGSASALV